MAIIAKNVTASGVEIPDLSGIFITASGQADLREFFSIDTIELSLDLKDLINDDVIILNDGIEDLSKEESLEHASLATIYEALPYFTKLKDTPTTYSGILPSNRFIKIKPDETGLEFTSIDMMELENAPPTMSGYDHHFLRVNHDGDGWVYVDITNSLTWAGDPTYDGDVYITGRHERVDNIPPNSPSDPFSLSSGSPITSPKKAFNTHVVVNILTTSSTPFTVTVSGVVVNDVTGGYLSSVENITITGTGYYQTIKSFVDKPRFDIVEESKSCTFDLYMTTHWDAAGNVDFIVKGCRLEWTPDQQNWEVGVNIYHQRCDGSMVSIDEIYFDEYDTYIRADIDRLGKYKRTDYGYHVEGTNLEGIIITMSQRAIGHYFFELDYSLGD